MPSENKTNEGYRSQPGTSIAVRIGTNKEFEGFCMKTQLERFLMAPPIMVKHDGIAIGGDFDALLNTPWATAQSFDLNEEFVQRVRVLTGMPFESGIKISLLPISLTEDALSPNIKGQLLITYIDLPKDTFHKNENIRFSLDSTSKKVDIKCVKITKKEGSTSEEHETEDVSFLFEHLSIPEAIAMYPYPFERYYLGSLRFSHNGIRIPENSEIFGLNRYMINNYYPFAGHHHNFSFICTGVIYFQDELLPNLTVSRNEIREITFPVAAHLLSSLRTLNQLVYDYPEQHRYNFFEKLSQKIDFSSGVMKRSNFYEKNKEFWDQEIKIQTCDGIFSVAELIEKSPIDLEFFIGQYSSPFYRNLVDYVLESNFDVIIRYQFEESIEVKRFYMSKKTSLNPLIVEGFEPLTFVRFKDETTLVPGREVNLDHPYTKWYIQAYSVLSIEYVHYAKQLIYALFGSWQSSKPEIEIINRILEKLRKVLPEDIQPPKGINLTKSDFGRKES